VSRFNAQQALSGPGRNGLILALIAVTAFLLGRGMETRPALATGVNSNQDMIAVTGEFGRGTSVLYLIDTRAKTLAVYQAKGGSQSNLKLIAARDITYDLKVRSYNDVSEPAMKVEELERRWRQFQKGGKRAGRKMAPNQSRRKPPMGPETPKGDPSKTGGEKKRE
jgi:hypothetical protein